MYKQHYPNRIIVKHYFKFDLKRMEDAYIKSLTTFIVGQIVFNGNIKHPHVHNILLLVLHVVKMLMLHYYRVPALCQYAEHNLKYS